MPSLKSSPGKMNQSVTAPGRLERVPRFDPFYCENPVVSTGLSWFLRVLSAQPRRFGAGYVVLTNWTGWGPAHWVVSARGFRAKSNKHHRDGRRGRVNAAPVSACLVADQVEDQAMGRVTDGHLVGYAEWADSSGSFACHRREWVAHPKNKAN